MYDEEKAAQAAAFLLSRANGKLPLISLLKLMYLAERLSFERYGIPLTGDRLFSLNNGPILSATLDHMNGAVHSKEGGWDSWVSDRADHMVALHDGIRIESAEADLMALSESDLEVLAEIWATFGHMDRWELVEYTHTLPEWAHPKGGAIPIAYEDLFTAIGYPKDVAENLRQQMVASHRINRAFS